MGVSNISLDYQYCTIREQYQLKENVYTVSEVNEVVVQLAYA